LKIDGDDRERGWNQTGHITQRAFLSVHTAPRPVRRTLECRRSASERETVEEKNRWHRGRNERSGTAD
jgi:hypothetical protein